jgi:pimeloyl-ACP methyl ester carboxylesterase
LLAPFPARAGQSEQKLDVGGRTLFLNCVGESSGPTVVLMAGAGGTSSVWSAVQKETAAFARVCSYDRAGLGQSDKTAQPQTAAEIVDDLHRLLVAAAIRPPYVLVGHSIGGIYIRIYAMQYPRDVAGLVFVDSSHEEQLSRYAAISTRILDLEPGPKWHDVAAMRKEGFNAPGEELTWRTDVPVVALEHGAPSKPPPGSGIPDEDFARLEAAWHEMQVDLASRSLHGQLRRAEDSGHYIQIQQPGLVVTAIRDVMPAR